MDAPTVISPALPELTNEEDTFALAVVEYGGNLSAAFQSVFGERKRPHLAAQRLIARPEIALRIKQIHEATTEHALISLGSHLQQLAQIRDRADSMGEMKVALDAEVKRGEVAGYYKKESAGGGSGPSVHIHMNTPAPPSAHEWAEKFGKAPIIIENGA